MPQRLTADYLNLIATGTIEAEPSQQAAVAALQRLSDSLAARGRMSLAALWSRSVPPHGIYLCGPVGRGKTMLMNLFFRTVAVKHKRRLHFDAFMGEAHAAIEAARAASPGDPIPPAARALAQPGTLLCIDEFQVNDIADAMIIGRLFEQLLASDVTLVATSNTLPGNLYPDGINRALFLPFVAQLQSHVDVIELSARRDYRMSKLAGRPLYFTPADGAAHAALEASWTLLTNHATGAPQTLDLKGRTLTIPRTADGTAWSSFDALCGAALGAADYRALALAFHTLILEDIPILSPERRNEARRLILLIDVLYDERRHLIASAAAEPHALYPLGDGHEAFGRTASRLVDMRSQDYLDSTTEPQPPAGRSS
jgi:cell division protein ZapE